ncbi:MAG TPA: hypothetical protein ENN51_06605 [candidate division WOR-3 bacterium]|uniref:GNAT family N-acetyltransferase n=1 Tax=candidate division WOR-3 bacterium TaxID=2052148 RepID=A0A7V0XFQ3_UNCW3|nr:hypothetical protein [candidate division WOR-3 bacterium]
MPQTAPLIVPVDGLLARTLELDGQLCFRCPLLEDPRTAPDPECPVHFRDLAPVLQGPRSGVLASVTGGRTVAYAVFGPPAVFRNAPDLPFELDDDALLIAALYAIPEARDDNTDVDLLIAVIRFAAEQGFTRLQAVCRDDPAESPEPRTAVIRAAGFELTEPERGLRLGTLTVSSWGAPAKPTEEAS